MNSAMTQLIRDLTETIGGRVQFGSLPPLGGDFEPVGRFVCDVREIQPGDVWWALETSEHDSASRAEEAYLRGALGVVVQGRHVEPWAGKFSVLVEDVRWALWQLAGAARRRFRGSLIAVGGSLGKSTTRQLIDAVLRTRYSGLAISSELDTRLSVPLMLALLDATHDYGIVAYTSRRKGEIQAISHLCCPDVAVINCLTIERPTDVAETADQREAELLREVPSSGFVVLNGDDPHLRRLVAETGARGILVGRSSHCHPIAEKVSFASGRLSFLVEGMPISVPLWGRHHLHAALAAYAVGRILELTPVEIAQALSSCRALPGRCRLHRHPDLTVIDDTRDSSEASTLAALEALREAETSGRRVVICGEPEGAEASSQDERIGQALVAMCGVDLLITCGAAGRRLVAAAQRAGLSPKRTVWCQSVETLPEVAGSLIRRQDVVLVKGQTGDTVPQLMRGMQDGSQRAAA